MKISEILNSKRVTLSFEVFPLKTSEGYQKVRGVARRIAALRPDFMSVTYGAGGGTSRYTLDIADEISTSFGVPSLAHLTFVSSTRADVADMIRQYKERGIENILALRGDIPAEGRLADDYYYAVELIHELRQADPSFCIGGACYPEGHIECAHKADDIRYLKEKVDAGLDFLTTQMFFDNNILYNFLYRVREAGIRVPVIAGIMPITNVKQVKRSVEMSGTVLPENFRSILDAFGDRPDVMRQAGMAYAVGQIIDLIANDVTHIHVYSMNDVEIATGILNALSAVLSGQE